MKMIVGLAVASVAWSAVAAVPDCQGCAHRPLAGAIRWDCWAGKDGIRGGEQTRVLEKTLAPEKYRWRLPWFAEVKEDGSVSIDGAKPGVMEQEIDYAADAGLDYFIFLNYGINSHKTDAVDRFRSARNTKKMQYAICFMFYKVDIPDEIWPQTVAKYVAYFEDENYVRVCGNRPLVYTMHIGDEEINSRIHELKSAAAARGLNPYFVYLNNTPDEMWPKMKELGYDAYGMYATAKGLASVPCAYGDFATNMEDRVQGVALRKGRPCVPCCQTGWQKDPRKDYVPYWEKGQAYHSQPGFPAVATPDEIVDSIQRVRDFVSTHPEICPANTFTVYAWNEHDEGGWLCPTWTPSGVPDTSRIDALKKAREYRKESKVRFQDGLLSRVKPKGWLADLCARQRDGLTGHPKALAYPYDSCLWAGRIARSGEHGDGWWRYEQTAYYTDGLLRLGYALNDSSMVARAKEGINYTLAHQSEKGFLGDPCLWDSEHYRTSPGREMWPMAVFFRVLKAYWDATGDERILEALGKYYSCYSADAISTNRNIVSVEGMTWLYERTKDKRLLDVAEEAWAKANPGEGKGAIFSGGLNPENCASDEALYLHGVTYCEEMKVPLLLYAATGKKDYLFQARNVLDKLVGYHMLPDGCPSSVEQTRGNSVHWGHETCDVSDFSWSLGYFLEITGDAQYADMIERCVFNAGLGAVTKDFKALQYFSNLNQFICRYDSNHNPYAYGTSWAQYRPTHSTECCAGNVNRFLPNYISRMWLKDAKGNPVAALYGPSVVDYGFVKIEEETDYPFSGKIRFRFNLKEPKSFAFTYRVPVWCRGHADCGKFVTVERTFSDGDTLDLDFPMETAFEKVAPRRYVVKDATVPKPLLLNGASGSQGVVVRRGPLVFAFPIVERRTEDTLTHKELHGKVSGEPDFKCWNLDPAGPFNYALARHEAKVTCRASTPGAFTLSGSPLLISVPVKRIRWGLEGGRYTPDLPKNVEAISDVEEVITLVPYGATCLRLSVFPEL